MCLYIHTINHKDNFKSNKQIKQERVIIVGPKEDAQILSKKMIKENKNNVLSDMFSMK